MREFLRCKLPRCIVAINCLDVSLIFPVGVKSGAQIQYMGDVWMGTSCQYVGTGRWDGHVDMVRGWNFVPARWTARWDGCILTWSATEVH